MYFVTYEWCNGAVAYKTQIALTMLRKQKTNKSSIRKKMNRISEKKSQYLMFAVMTYFTIIFSTISF